MYPPEFVKSMIASGKVGHLIDLIDKFTGELFEKNPGEHAPVYSFAKKFLISVAGQLRRLQPGQSLDEDHVLSTWRDLGFFGIRLDDIGGILDQRDSTSQTNTQDSDDSGIQTP